MLRAAAAALGIAAVATQGAVTIGGAIAAGRHLPTTIVNFFSFFTILSNIAAVIVLAWAAGWFWLRGRRRGAASPEPRVLAFALAAATTYMLVTGVVYNVLLRGIPLPQGTTVPWANEVLHVVAPAFLLLDLLLAPRRRALAWRTIFGILAFPIGWVVYTMVRGPLTTNPVTGDGWWYPYPFLNPHLQPWGYGGVALYVVGIALAIGTIAAIVVWVGRLRGSTEGARGISAPP